MDDIAPTLTSPLLPGLVGNILQLERPEMPGEPASFKADGNLWGSGRMHPEPEVPIPFHTKGKASKRPASKMEAQQNEPPSQGGRGESPDSIPVMQEPSASLVMKNVLFWFSYSVAVTSKMCVTLGELL